MNAVLTHLIKHDLEDGDVWTYCGRGVKRISRYRWSLEKPGKCQGLDYCLRCLRGIRNCKGDGFLIENGYELVDALGPGPGLRGYVE